MPTLESNLLLLITNLSQLKNKKQVIRLFIEGASALFQKYQLKWHFEADHQQQGTFRVCTREKTFGFIETDQAFENDARVFPHFQNAIQLLAIILENLEQYELLHNQKAHLQQLVDQQTLELIRSHDEINETNEELATTNEELIESNQSLIEINQNLYEEIEKREVLEKKLLESDKFFKHSTDLFCIAGFDGYFKVLNPTWETVLGWSIDEMLAKPWNDFLHPDDITATENIKSTIVDGREVYHFENRYRCKNGAYKWLSWNSYPHREENIMFGVARDVTSLKEAENRLKQIEWMLNANPRDINQEALQPGYGDLTTYNPNGLIVNSINKEELNDIANDYLGLLETSSAIYEKNGDYALGIFSSGWCRFMDSASRKLCNTKSNRKALKSGKWLCHESCWTDASKKAIETGKTVDIQCNGGLNLYVEPIKAAEKVVGAINFGYGDPPTNDHVLKELAEKYQVSFTELKALSKTYESRPPFVVELARKRLKYSARQIGTLIERKQAKDKLKESEEKFKNIVQSSPNGMYFYQLNKYKQLIFKGANPAADRIIGLKHEDFIGKTLQEAFPNLASTFVPDLYAKIARGEEPSNTFEIAYDDSKAKGYFEVTVYQTGKNNIAVEFLDISERKAYESYIKQSEEKYRTLIDFAPDAFFQGDVNGNFIEVNIKASELTGYSKEELLSMNMSQLFSPSELINNPLRFDLLQKGETVISERTIHKKNGNSLLIEMNSRQLPDGSMQSFVRDISERIKTEEQLRTLTVAINQSPNSIVITNKKGIIEYVNPVIEKLSGYKKEELLGQNPRIFSSGKTSKEEYKELWETISSGKVWQGEFQNKKKNGTLFWESATISPVFNGKGKITHYLAIREDITAQKKMTLELIAAKEKAEESDRLKTSFLANMSHEIRTPMNSIMGFASLLPEEESKELMCQYANIIVRNSEQLVHIIDDIVLYSRLQTRLLQNIASEFNVSDLINDIKQSFNLPEFNMKGIELIGHVENGKEGSIKTDYDKLRQIFTNLVANSYKYTDQGSITLGAVAKDKQLCFYVQDTGIGIPEKEKEKVFERFFRGSNASRSNIGGTGLGLSIVKELVELLGGKIWVESEEGKGSTFYFTLSR
ncbi:PAS domain S-box protein [Roseimarinus sediminis]|uniref:PAS domain S-box protein n=1 Tax=Roseimarinus sediminis TaxID=1610899 RepID=UPI003D1DCF12